MKPLDGMGGKDIYKLKVGDETINEVLKHLTNQGQRYIMAQEFLPEIKQGDKRILLINGMCLLTMHSLDYLQRVVLKETWLLALKV